MSGWEEVLEQMEQRLASSVAGSAAVDDMGPIPPGDGPIPPWLLERARRVLAGTLAEEQRLRADMARISMQLSLGANERPDAAFVDLSV